MLLARLLIVSVTICLTVGRDAWDSKLHLVKCKFVVVDILDTVHYGGEDITSSVVGDPKDPYEDKHVHFEVKPGAYLVITGHREKPHDDVNGCSTAGLRIECSNGISSRSSWKSVGASFPIGKPYVSGSGYGWGAPCTISAFGKTAYVSELYAMLRGNSAEYFAFRIGTDVSCKFMVYDVVDSVHYNGKDITSSVEGDASDPYAIKTVSFTPVKGAFLAIAGHNVSVDATGNSCPSSGLHIECSDGITGDSGWQGYADRKSLSTTHASGAGSGWFAPCKSTKGLPPELQGTPKIAVNSSHFAFRIRTDVSCTIMTPHHLDDIFYNGINMTSTTVSFLFQLSSFVFTPAPGAYVVVSGHFNDGFIDKACTTNSFMITCTDGISVLSDWEVVGSNQPLGKEQLAGNGGGWDVPCVGATVENYSAGLQIGQPILGVNTKYFAFRHRLHHSDEWMNLKYDIIPAMVARHSRVLMVAVAFCGIMLFAWFYKRRQRKVKLHSYDLWLG